MAVGATPRAVLGMVLGTTARLTLIGSAAGAAVGLVATRTTTSVLVGVTPRDPLTFAGAIAVILAVALVAAYLTGRRASHTNAVEAVRMD